MKSLLFTLLSLFTLSAFAPFENITGNGNVKKETRKTNDFTAISLRGNMNVDVSYGSADDITVEADENLLSYIETIVENGTLVIKSKDKVGLNSKNKIIVRVSATKLTAVHLSGSGNINGNGKFTNDGLTKISVSGSGNINLGIDNFNETKINISGSGNVTLKGNSTNNVDATISGSGNIDCSGVSCNDVFAHVSGSGNIRVYANKSIDAKVSGSGNIYYKGAATKINMKASGSGKVIKV